MGTSTSRFRSPPSPTPPNRSLNTITSILICGGSSSRAPHEMFVNVYFWLIICGLSGVGALKSVLLPVEEYSSEITVHSARQCDPVINLVEKSPENTRTIFSGTVAEIGASQENNTQSSEYALIEDGSRILEESRNAKQLAQTKELSSHYQLSSNFILNEPYLNRSSTLASTSSQGEPSSDLVSINISPEDGINGIGNSENEAVFLINHEHNTAHPQEVGDLVSNLVADENHADEMTLNHSSVNDSVSGVPLTFQSLRDEAIPSGLGFLMSNSEQGREDGSIFHVDMVSISSNILANGNIGTSSRDARRNSRRLFWDAFSRHSSRRLNDSPTIVFSTDDPDDLVSHDRWLLDFSGDLSDEGTRSDSPYLGSRIHSRNERRLFSRSEIWERLNDGIHENYERNAFCPSGLHPDGACSCETLMMTEESSTRASISRIVMLAEALFEVLDEINRQPVSLLVSLPASESVVDSFPLKNHKMKTNEGGEEVEQCYICLAEYEDGDKIRILPCQHEYHMLCVDKWLKEIHGVCPLCRRDVRLGVKEGSTSIIPDTS